MTDSNEQGEPPERIAIERHGGKWLVWLDGQKRGVEYVRADLTSRASVAAVDEDAPTLLDRIEKLELDPNFSSHYLYGFELCREQVKNIIKEHPAVSSSLPAEPTPLCTCLAAGNQVAWEYVHHTNDCAIYKAGEVAKQWLLDHPQLKHSRIFAGAAAWDRETVATLLIQYAAQQAAPAEPLQPTGEQETTK